MQPMQLHWDIFCRVIDNHGDIGVCWRLARQLATEHGKRVRLWLDDLASLQPLCPAVDPALPGQTCQCVEILQWGAEIAVDRVAEVVIEAFACELPRNYLQAMAAATPKPCWINLEYLTAEPWAEDCHGLASPHPTLPLVKYFYFPGFTAASGGLLRERDLFARRDTEPGLDPDVAALDISLFCYDDAPVGELLDCLAASPAPVCLHVAPGKPLAAVARQLGGDGPWQLGQMQVLPFAFLPQDDFDRLLWRCTINFVRGEDSFVRAQWAARPFIWQVYPQADDAHLVKLDAFLQRHTEGLSPEATAATVDVFKAWNLAGELRPAWAAFLAQRSEIAAHNRHWADHLAELPDLAAALVNFCATKV